jgi:hypothetical protein
MDTYRVSDAKCFKELSHKTKRVKYPNVCDFTNNIRLCLGDTTFEVALKLSLTDFSDSNDNWMEVNSKKIQMEFERGQLVSYIVTDSNVDTNLFNNAMIKVENDIEFNKAEIEFSNSEKIGVLGYSDVFAELLFS